MFALKTTTPPAGVSCRRRAPLTIRNFKEDERTGAPLKKKEFRKTPSSKAAAPAPVPTKLSQTAAVQAPPAPTTTGTSQLEQLARMSKVVADTGEISLIAQYKPTDATTNPSLVLKAVETPAYAYLIPQAVAEFKKAHTVGRFDPLRPYAGIADVLAVEMGCEILKMVPGRVSTEVDAHLSYDYQATVDKALHLIDLYAKRGVEPSRVYIKMAATWEGIRACTALQAQGIDTNMTLLFSFAQAAAAADANAALISPFVGRILDFYMKKEPGRTFAPSEDPGVLSVRRIYSYYKTHGYETRVMAASFRNVGEIRELAGVDNITIAPKLLQELKDSTEPLVRKCDPTARDSRDAVVHHNVGSFRSAHERDAMASEKLTEGINGFVVDQKKLEVLIAKQMLL